MAEFKLPKNSRLTVGKTWPVPEGNNIRTVKVYRYDFEAVYAHCIQKYNDMKAKAAAVLAREVYAFSNLNRLRYAIKST